MGTLRVGHKWKASWGGDPLRMLLLAFRTTLFRMKPHLEGVFHLLFGDNVADYDRANSMLGCRMPINNTRLKPRGRTSAEFSGT